MSSPSNGLVIAELSRLAQWVREGREYDRDDARDEIARAIENRVRELEHGMKPQELIRQAMELIKTAARMEETDEDLAVSAKAAWADLHWALTRDQQKQDNT